MQTPIILAEKILLGEVIGFFIISVIYCIISYRKYKRKEISKNFLKFEFVYFSFINAVIIVISILQFLKPGFVYYDAFLTLILLLIIVVVRVANILYTGIDMIEDEYDNAIAVTLTIVSFMVSIIYIGIFVPYYFINI